MAIRYYWLVPSAKYTTTNRVAHCFKAMNTYLIPTMHETLCGKVFTPRFAEDFDESQHTKCAECEQAHEKETANVILPSPNQAGSSTDRK